MPYEPFLVNEPRRIRSKRFRRNLIGEELMILGNPRRKRGIRARRNIAKGFHDSSGKFHPIRASFDYSPSRAGESSMMKRRPKVKRKYGTKPKFKRKPLKRRTVKKAKTITGKEVKAMAKRKKAVKRNEPRKRRRSFRRNEPRKRKRSFRRNEPRKRRRSFRRNEPRKRRRSFRRNPATSMIKEFSPSKLMSIAPYFITGAASMIATAKVPTLIGAGDSMLWKYGSQLVSAIGGGILVGKFFGKTHGFVWAAVGGSVVAADLISNYVLKQVGISGLAEDLIEYQPSVGAYPYAEVGAYPYAEVGAYPYAEISGYPYAEVGAYPYSGEYAY